jgi:hypothetical protein
VFRLLFLLLGSLTASRSASGGRLAADGSGTSWSGADRPGDVGQPGRMVSPARPEPAGRGSGEPPESAKPGTVLADSGRSGGWLVQHPGGVVAGLAAGWGGQPPGC